MESVSGYSSKSVSSSNVSSSNIDILQLLAFVVLPVRLVYAWMYISAPLRRMVLASGKLDPNSPLWVGHKFNSFLPHASNILWLHDFVRYLVLHPDVLASFLWVFTIIELLTGLGIALGLLSRLSAIGGTLLPLGMLLGAGWQGATCLDEWQIGSTGVAMGLTLFFAGSGVLSVDCLLMNKYPKLKESGWFKWLGSGPIFDNPAFNKMAIVGALFALFVTMGTNQYFQGGVWGKLHNFGKVLDVKVSNAHIQNGNLVFEAYRISGSSAAMAWIPKIDLIKDGKVVYTWDQKAITSLPPSSVKNIYINKAKINQYALGMRLGAKAIITLPLPQNLNLTHGQYTLVLHEIGGQKFSTTFTY